MAIRQFKPVTQELALPLGLGFRARSRGRRPRNRCSSRSRSRAGATTTGTSPCGGAAAVTSGMYRVIDFRRNKFGVPATVREIEYDPNRSARIALVEYADGEKRYILHPRGLCGRRHDRVGPGLGRADGQRDAAARDAAGHRRAQRRAQGRQGRPDGAVGGHVGRSGRQGRRVRDACACARRKCGWCTATVWRRSARWATPSTSCCRGARPGKTRWMGRRPKVRGEVMNPVDHPHGGRTRGGRNVVSPWGKKEGVKTRNKKKASQRLIVRGRKRGKATQ